MAQTHPLVLPDRLVSTYGLDLEARYGAGWWYRHYDVAFSPSGETYTLSGLWRNKRGGDDAQDPADRSFNCGVITRYGADGAPLSMALCGVPAPDGRTSAVSDVRNTGLCVLPDGTVALSTMPDCTYLLDGQLRAVRAAYTMPDRIRPGEPTGGSPFATRIRVTPSGRLLCALTEFGAGGRSGYRLNLLAVTDGRLTPYRKPDLEVIAACDPDPVHRSAGDLRRHVVFGGRPLGPVHRPSPSLAELVPRTGSERFWYETPWLGVPEPLGDDLFVLPVFGRTFRGGSKGQPFTFTLIDAKGGITGRLQGLDRWRDSPFTGECFIVRTDPHRGRAFHLNRYGLYAWSRDGSLRARLPTGDKPFTLLWHFALLGCSPGGELVLAHKKQHLLLRVPVPDALEDLGGAVATALAAYGRRRTILKRALSPVNWHWTDSFGGDRLHYV